MSDVDGDGYGVLSAPQDPAPFTKSIHPYALEIPGNGVDEDGVAGDLPADFARYVEPVRPFVPACGRRSRRSSWSSSKASVPISSARCTWGSR
jgi:hypothetical protein